MNLVTGVIRLTRVIGITRVFRVSWVTGLIDLTGLTTDHPKGVFFLPRMNGDVG